MYVFLSFVISHAECARCMYRIYSIMMRFIRDFIYYYRMFGPKYGWFWSIEYSRFNAMYKKREDV